MGMHHLVSRGVTMVHEHMGNPELQKITIPTWGAVLLGVTLLIYMALHFSISYTYGLMVPILAMTEEPSTTMIVRTAEYQDDESADAPLLTKEEKEYKQPRVDEEVLIIAHKPLTSKFRTIIRHLKEKTGTRTSRYRGLGGYIIYNIAFSWALHFSRALGGRAFGQLLHIPLVGALCLLSTAWVQQVVSMPGKSYFQRIGELSRADVFKTLFFQAMFVELIETAFANLPRQVIALLQRYQMVPESERPDVAIVAVGVALAVATMLFSFFCVVIPLNISFVRIQASYIPEETETVVPVDRTLGGAERKDLRAGWKSFTREGCFRLAKTWIKLGLMQVALMFMFIFVAVSEMRLIVGEQLAPMMREHADRMML